MLRERHYAPEAIQSRLQEMEELWEELLASCQDKRAKLQDAYKVISVHQWLGFCVISRSRMNALLQSYIRMCHLEQSDLKTTRVKKLQSGE